MLPAESYLWRSVVSSSLGAAFLRAGDLAEAAVAFGEAARLGDRSGNVAAAVDALCRQGYLLSALGRLREAEFVYRQGLGIVTPQAGAPLYLGLGQIQLERGELVEAHLSLTEARRRSESAEVLLALARVHQARGEAAAAGWVKLSLEARSVEAMAARAGSPSLIEPLTEREREILQLLADVCSNQDVAQRLFMGVSTVKWHLINIYGKLQ